MGNFATFVAFSIEFIRNPQLFRPDIWERPAYYRFSRNVRFYALIASLYANLVKQTVLGQEPH